MNNCPNCGVRVTTDEPVCICGELLRADVTHHLNSWETETVFHPRSASRANLIAAIAVTAVVTASIVGLSWPRLSRSWDANPEAETSLAGQTFSRSDMVEPSDLIEGDPPAVTQEGVFDFTKGEKLSNTRLRAMIKRSNIEAVGSDGSANPAASLNAQLKSDKTDELVKPTDVKPLADCKPEITAALKPAQPPVPATEPKPQPKQSGTNYILGPRGGCFFVTATGGKKYVDHSLCGGSSTAAARQD